MAPTPPARSSGAVRHFGRYQLLQLLGKSTRTMAWLAADSRSGSEVMLVMPRSQVADASALERWLQQARRAARIDHPVLARPLEIGEVEHWPFVAYERERRHTLAERRGRKALPASEVVPWAIQILLGLAFAHEAGVAHRDLQPFAVLLGDGTPCLAGLGVAYPERQEGDGPTALQAQRAEAERDVLAFGLLLHLCLAGTPALEQVDLHLAMQQMPPWGREIVRLPWNAGLPIADALRAIVNRSTDRQERQRYRNARTLAGALEGWWRAEGGQGADPMALLADRVRAAGLLPAIPGGAARAARLALMERERTSEMAAIVLKDVALTFELLRMVNSVQARSTMAVGQGPVLTIRRTIAMLGLDGVRRAALALRAWPGPLDEAQAAMLDAMMRRARRAGVFAQWFRPRGYDAEVVYLLTLLQNLGRLVVQYHFPDEARQIVLLMQPAAPEKPGDPETPGMTEEGAAYAVLGIDIESIGVAVGRHWGLDDSVLAMMRRPSTSRPVHGGDSDADLLRVAAGCGNEVADVFEASGPKRAAMLQRVARRYGRALGLTPHDIEVALQDAAAMQAQMDNEENAVA